jgi:hypothetical protein
MNDMIMSMDTFKPGDILGFSGDTWVSATINLATYGIPYWHLSHVGIVAEWDGDGYPGHDKRGRITRAQVPRLLLFE